MIRLNELSLKEREELFRLLRVSLTHHSSAIEGITLSFGETKELLEKGYTAGHKPLGEQLVVLGFAKAYDVIIREASNKANIIDSNFIKDIHSIVFSDVLNVTPDYVIKPIGAYRTDERYIKGVDIKLSSPNKISQDIDNLFFRFKSNDMDLNNIAEFYIQFEQIHPFADGNGRVGRLLMAYQAIQNDFIPPLIENEKRNRYLDSLNDKNSLHSFLEKSIKMSLELSKNI